MKKLNHKNTAEALAFLSDHRDPEIVKYKSEYQGDRKVRDLQVGHRPDLKSTRFKNIPAEKMVVNLQKKIVKTSSSFLFGEPPSIGPNDAKNEKAVQVLDLFKKNRIYSKLQDFAETVMSETMGVFIFASGDEKGKEVTVRHYGYNEGTFVPRYDLYGDLVAFYWEFINIEGDKILWIFDDTKIYQHSGKDEYKFTEEVEHGFSVIPVVFLEQDYPEWWDVKEMIDRLEMILSKLAGSNNYFAFPILKLKGAVYKNPETNEDESLIDQSDDGKSLLLGFAELNNQVVESDADFLTRDTGVDSIKLEIEYLKEMIFNISQTPDTSFNNVKGIGAISGKALLLMLQDAINKAKSKQGQYRIVIERILNVIKSGIGASNSEGIDFDIRFNLSIPKDTKEEIQNLVEAAGGSPILSQKSAVKHSPFTEDIEEELRNLEEQKIKENSLSLRLEE